MTMIRSMKTVAVALAAAGLTACNDGRQFRVEGSIAEAQDSVLYFENMSLEGPVVIDSVRLGGDGKFSFSDKASGAPEFYRLRIAGQIINISADSTETVTVRAAYPTMATAYEVEGSANCSRIRELALKQIDLHRRAMALEASATLTREEIRDSLLVMTESYKNDVKMGYIMKDPGAASSYFALFQTIGGYLIFNPHSNLDDMRVFRAVATAWDTFHPESLRAKNLHNIAIEGVKTERIINANNNRSIDPAKVTTSGIIDLTLEDNHGVERSLSSLAGKVVLLDYHLFASPDSPKRILMLRELYNKFHERGFEIYQIAVDTDEHYWKQQTAQLPWTTVMAPDGAGSQCVRVYNVQRVPEFFLIDRGNNLVSRSEQIGDLEAEIEKLL